MTTEPWASPAVGPHTNAAIKAAKHRIMETLRVRPGIQNRGVDRMSDMSNMLYILGNRRSGR